MNAALIFASAHPLAALSILATIAAAEWGYIAYRLVSIRRATALRVRARWGV